VAAAEQARRVVFQQADADWKRSQRACSVAVDGKNTHLGLDKAMIFAVGPQEPNRAAFEYHYERAPRVPWGSGL
jgi:hypothetical protein